MGACCAAEPEPEVTKPGPWKPSKLPQVWFTSSGLQSEKHLVQFLQTLLLRRGVLETADASDGVVLENLRNKYAAELSKVKVVQINDSLWHRSVSLPAKKQAILKAQEDHDPSYWHFFNKQLVSMCGIAKQNVMLVSLFNKPWLFDQDADPGFFDAQKPQVSELDPADSKAYFAALQKTHDAYAALVNDEPVPSLPSGKSCGVELGEVSARLNDKYRSALDKWCQEYIAKADVICGQGGDVVMLNFAFQANQPIAKSIIQAVRSGNSIYIGQSAGGMVMAQTIELTKEIKPGWLDAFTVDPVYLKREGLFTANDMDGEGTHANVLGALPLIDAPMAFRPHHKPAWEEEVQKRNLVAEKEFELEHGTEIDDKIVAESNQGAALALKLLNHISGNTATQDNPVFVPLKNGKIFSCERVGTKEVFRVVPC